MTFIPYQIDHSVQNTAKTLGFSKKRINFKFGFASEAALAQGLTGVQCRGSEHEVIFIWSLKTGKRQLYLDGKDVHFSESGMNGWTVDRSWQHAFNLRDSSGKSFRIHFISQPINPNVADSKPFDLRVNGISYFAFNEIWKLGTAKMIAREAPRQQAQWRPPAGTAAAAAVRSPNRRTANTEEELLSPEERRQIAQAKAESLRDLAIMEDKRKKEEAAQKQEAATLDALISFDPAPAPTPAAVPGGGYYGAPPPQQPPQQPFFGAPAPAPGALVAVAPAAGVSPGYSLPGGTYPQQQPSPFAATPAPASYGAPFGQPPAAPPGNPYGQAPAFGALAPQQPPSAFGAPPPQPPPPATPAGATPFQGLPSPAATAPPAFNYGAPPQGFPNPAGGVPPQLGSPGGQSVQSFPAYGSAPSFAQPQQLSYGYPPQGQPAAPQQQPFGNPAASYPGSFTN